MKPQTQLEQSTHAFIYSVETANTPLQRLTALSNYQDTLQGLCLNNQVDHRLYKQLVFTAAKFAL